LVAHTTVNTNMPQQQHQQQVTGSSTLIDLDDIDAFLGARDTDSSTPIDLDDAFSGARDRESERHGDVTYKDQVREVLLSSSLATAAASAAAGRGRAAPAAHEIPMVSAIAVSQSQISAEAEEDRLHDVERRAAAAAAEAVRNQVEQLERKLAAVRPPPHQAPHHIRRSVNHYDVDEIDDFEDKGYNDEENGQKQHQIVERENNNASTAGSTAKQPLAQRRVVILVAVAVAVVIAAAVALVVGICGTGHCHATSPTPSSTPINTDRAIAILPYINILTLSGRTLMYPSSSSAEERAVKWLIDEDLNTTVDDEQAIRQRYALSTLWFLRTRTGFGTDDGHKKTWTTNIDECEWLDVYCDDRGRVTALNLGDKKVRGQIPDDLGLLTDMTTLLLHSNRLTGTIPSSFQTLTALLNLGLSSNELTSTIPSSIGDMTALTSLQLWSNQLRGTIPSSFQTLTALVALGLSDNELTGTIPSSFSTLTTLTQVWLDDNQLVGTVPFCNSNHTLTSLVVDCPAVVCTCCNGC
jgi:hypothetical protein